MKYVTLKFKNPKLRKYRKLIERELNKAMATDKQFHSDLEKAKRKTVTEILNP